MLFGYETKHQMNNQGKTEETIQKTTLSSLKWKEVGL
jgi:hypothetical protein